MSKEQFKEIVELLRNTYRQQEFMADISEWTAWYECLKDLQFEWLKPAVIQWVQENKFPPTIAELRDLYHKTKGQSKWQ